MRGSPYGAVEPVRHRQETLDLAAWRERLCQFSREARLPRRIFPLRVNCLAGWTPAPRSARAFWACMLELLNWGVSAPAEERTAAGMQLQR
jgi:hypothetical protein